MEHQGKYVKFLDLDITTEDGIFVYIFFDIRGEIRFFIVCLPHVIFYHQFSMDQYFQSFLG